MESCSWWSWLIHPNFRILKGHLYISRWESRRQLWMVGKGLTICSIVCLFGMILYFPVNNFSVMSEWVLLKATNSDSAGSGAWIDNPSIPITALCSLYHWMKVHFNCWLNFIDVNHLLYMHIVYYWPASEDSSSADNLFKQFGPRSSPTKCRGLIWIQSVWHSNGILERIFWKNLFWKKKISRRRKIMKQNPACKELRVSFTNKKLEWRDTSVSDNDPTYVMQLYLLVSSADKYYKQFGPRSDPTKWRACSGSKLFDTQEIFQTRGPEGPEALTWSP